MYFNSRTVLQEELRKSHIEMPNNPVFEHLLRLSATQLMSLHHSHELLSPS